MSPERCWLVIMREPDEIRVEICRDAYPIIIDNKEASGLFTKTDPLCIGPRCQTLCHQSLQLANTSDCTKVGLCSQ